MTTPAQVAAPRVARARIVSVPARLPIRRLTVNEPLAPAVVLLPVKNRWPSSPIRTAQVWPTRFASTSNSTSILPSSDWAFSF